MFLKIRPETPSDYPEIIQVNDLAFGQPSEGKLVEILRKNPKFIPGLSLVAEIDGKIAGHILFFPVVIKLGSCAIS
ncbi:MAG: N-acetyltransferase [Methanosarcina sp.]|nr:N-acetyltransferase [Methanosarcina sp.]MDD3873316.1 N-acetyltransferase [Methanosarcina sp.]MDD4522979.1 N-acetyltransferase [Methanosarcina sp.]